MFKTEIYVERRKILKKRLSTGILLFLGNDECPMNYQANQYPFRQDSTFLYYFGLDSPGLAAVIDLNDNKEFIFGEDYTLEDAIWMGYLPRLKDRAEQVGVKKTGSREALKNLIKSAREKKRDIHYLPPYRTENAKLLEDWLGIPQEELKAKASKEFIQAVVDQRMVKSQAEIQEIEKALDVTFDMFNLAIRFARPNHYEYEVAGAMEAAALCHSVRPAFPLIVTKNGHILHNHAHHNLLQKGNLLVADAGAESALHYASDITRTFPVGGKFSRRQKEIYQIVLDAQTTAIKSLKPEIKFKEIHLKTARVIASGLKDLGLMKGNVDDAVAAGAHALFFPHGLGHNLGLDVHDMEDLGENYVGYDETVKRSEQFGLAYLRMARTLKPGYVLTVEPGIYFIPPLYEKWKKEKKFLNFINYDKVEKYLDFGGIRLEDNILVTKNGHKVLGKPIPKTIEEVELAFEAV